MCLRVLELFFPNTHITKRGKFNMLRYDAVHYIFKMINNILSDFVLFSFIWQFCERFIFLKNVNFGE